MDFFCQLLESKSSFPPSKYVKKKESQIIIMSSFCSNCFHFRFSEAGFGEKIDQKSVNLQYNTLGRLDDGTNELSTKRLMFQVLFFSWFHAEFFAKILSIYLFILKKIKK